MIQIKGITKNFGELQVLTGIDLVINEGEVVSIVGPSGAGKTTLLQIMGTLDKADTGTVILNGTDVGALKEKELSAFRNRHIGFVFQFHQLLPEFTALENVMMPALIGGVSFSVAKKKKRFSKTKNDKLPDAQREGRCLTLARIGFANKISTPRL